MDYFERSPELGSLANMRKDDPRRCDILGHNWGEWGLWSALEPKPVSMKRYDPRDFNPAQISIPAQRSRICLRCGSVLEIEDNSGQKFYRAQGHALRTLRAAGANVISDHDEPPTAFE